MMRNVLGAAACWAIVTGGSAFAGDCPERADGGKTTADATCVDTAKMSDATTPDRDAAVTSARATASPETGTPARTAFPAAELARDPEADKYRYGPGAPPDPYGPDPNTWSATP